MKSKDVVLSSNVLGKKVTLCLLQLRSPFFHEANIMYGVQYPIIEWFRDQHIEREDRLKTCLESVSRFDRHINVLVLPEFSLSKAMVSIITQFAAKNSCVVIGNYYDAGSRTSESFVAAPDKEGPRLVTAPKSKRSKFETDILAETASSDAAFLRVRWSAEGKDYSLLVLTCMDFLQWPDLPEDPKDSDVLVSPMCSPNMDLFLSTAQNAIRWHSPVKRPMRSRVCVLCNTVELQPGGLNTCGGSTIIGPKYGATPILPARREAGLVVDIDCEELLTVPTPITGQDAVVEAPAIFLLDDQWRVSWTPQRANIPSDIALHPNVLGRLGLSRFYQFATVKHYWKIRDQFRGISVGCCGVYGFQDILLQSFEESPEFIELRLKADLPPLIMRDLGLREEHCLRVKGVLKYRGRCFVGERQSGEKASYYGLDKLRHLDREHIVQMLEPLQHYLEGQPLKDLAKNDLVEKGVLIEGLGSSDLTLEDLEQKKNEFLVFVELSAPEGDKCPARLFEEKVIETEILTDQRVRTIEMCESVFPIAAGFLRANYIFHIVGYLNDLSDIVLHKIHKTLGDSEVACRTRVVPVAESLSQRIYTSVSESIVEDDVGREWIIEIISENITERLPFLVKRLDSDALNRVFSIWRRAASWLSMLQEKPMEPSVIKEIRHQLARCIYSISWCLHIQNDLTVSDSLYFHLSNFCGPFYKEIAGKIESFLKNLVAQKKSQHGEAFAGRMEKAWKDGTKKGERSSFSDISRISLGQLIQSVIYWNDGSRDGDYIGHEGMHQRLKRLQSYGIADFRDCFAHTVEDSAAAIRTHIRSKKDIRRLLFSIDEALGFILEEQYERQA